MDKREQFRGVLVGLAAGDALGAPLEFGTGRSKGNYLKEMVGNKTWAPGEWTDDTDMTLGAVASLVSLKRFDPEDIANRFLAWKRSGPKDIGCHTSSVMGLIAAGKPWWGASRVSDPNNNACPNGSLMRCSPAGLLWHESKEQTVAASRTLGIITHAHKDCQDACIFWNLAIAGVLRGADKRKAVMDAATYLAKIGGSAKVAKAIAAGMEELNKSTPTGYVLDTLTVALWGVSFHDTFEDTIVEVANRGADADTVACVAGALAGAIYGLEGIPSRWRKALLGHDDLIVYADNLLELSAQGLSIPEIPEWVEGPRAESSFPAAFVSSMGQQDREFDAGDLRAALKNQPNSMPVIVDCNGCDMRGVITSVRRGSGRLVLRVKAVDDAMDPDDEALFSRSAF